MSQSDMEQQLAEAQETIEALQDELAETNRGLVALTLELEQRVDERTSELRAAHMELEKSNSELLQITLELEDRVTERTAELRKEIGERQDVEARLATLLSVAADAIIAIDAEQRIILFNKAAEEIFGYRAEEVLGQSHDLLVPERFVESHHQHVRDFAAAPEAARLMGERLVVTARRKDKTEFSAEISIAKLTLDGQTTFTVVLRDITDRKRAEEQLQTKNEEISNMSQQLWQTTKLATMGELAASIAHELNNPLATVSLRVESLLLQVPEGDLQRRALEVIEQETERMANLVANLLQFSRRSGQRISTVDVREEIENTLELVHYRFRNHRITDLREFASDVPLIHADRQQLRQLFLNVFTNAIDAMREQGSGTLTIRVQKAEGSGQKADGSRQEAVGGAGGSTALCCLPSAFCPLLSVTIEISDTGVGIAPENLQKVMEPFFTTKPEGKGTGLGMAICKRIVQEHHGVFDIESEVGKGTTVRISLPVTIGANGRFLEEE